MNKIAILVIGANAPRILGRVLDHFDDPRFRFFLHVDAKIDLGAYGENMRNLGRVTIVEPRVRVFWGGFSMIEAEFALIRAALAEQEIRSLVLWSDDTVPLRNPDDIYQALLEKPDRIAREVRSYTQEWYTNFYFGDSNFTSYTKHLEPRNFGPADWENMQRLQRFVERGKKKLEKVYFSRQWWALSRESAVRILDYLEEDEHLLQSFRYSLFPDETLFATLYRLCFPEAKVPDVPMFADYDRPAVPFVFTRPQDLPDLKSLPAHNLFLRKIWPWNTSLVDRIVTEWQKKMPESRKSQKPDVAEMVKTAEPPVIAAEEALGQEDVQKSLAAAVEAREDGDLEDSAKLFEAILISHPGHPEVTIEYVTSLRKLRRYGDADKALEGAIERHPDHFGLRRNWADLPTKYLDHDEVIRRGKIFRSVFPPGQYPSAWHSLAMEYGSLSEALRWDELRDNIMENLGEFGRHPHGFRIGLWQATELCMIDQLRTMTEAAPPDAWRQLPPEAKANTRLRIDMADLNKKLLEATKAQVIPIGQNCLPYLLGGRWGLIAQRERSEATTPFDRGAFQKDNAAAVIATDFAAFSDRSAFSETGVYDGSRMFQHDTTGVYFYHERGPFWMKDDGARFFRHLDRLIATWRAKSSAARRLFVFCLCGVGDLAKLVEAMEGRLLGPESHLLVVDVLQQPHPCPEHDHVTYVHLPYPADYTWDNFQHQSAARGVGFELSVVHSMVECLLPFLPTEEAASISTERRRILRSAAAASAAWRQDHDNTVALQAALYRTMSTDRQSVIGYARSLRANGKFDEAQNVLARQREIDPDSYELLAAWADVAVAPFDWTEKLARLRSLRQQFPPEKEVRSWGVIFQELRTLNEHGQWDEVVALIESWWSGFTHRADLFQSALGALLQLGQFAAARRLIADATPAVRKALPPNLLACVLQRLDVADENAALIGGRGVRVLSLGQNGLPTVLITRWGLRDGPRTFGRSTPFEFGDFFGETAAAVIADDFAALSDPANYTEKPAWGGGRTLRHVPSDVAFLVHRYARIGPKERQRFFSHLNEMIGHWRQVGHAGRRIFLHCHSGKSDLNHLVAVAREKLLGPEAWLVVIDQNLEPTPLAEDEGITLLHAPPPKNYPWFNATSSATPELMAYEQRVLAPVVALARRLALPAGEALAMSET